ncbi:MAG: BrnT family toxin [Candidatus Nitricoxidivorans perseverans]|uniref:BrnT family toxin n=1 Tax=Candidatus Nitricoxidivorans perseverans TaxID=2975601 RepID=A0AA49FLE2_9PROT|nr:MAG: BrnT family toxin [Candidatus Nitricoxidivorans perseverans]
MKLIWDEAKRQATLRERGIDFADAVIVFAGPTVEYEDTRRDYGESRMICFGLLACRLVAVGYVRRGNARHIFSMRKANDREIERYAKQLEKD